MKLFFTKTLWYAGPPPEGDTRPQYSVTYGPVCLNDQDAYNCRDDIWRTYGQTPEYILTEIIEVTFDPEVSKTPGVW